MYPKNLEKVKIDHFPKEKTHIISSNNFVEFTTFVPKYEYEVTSITLSSQNIKSSGF